MSPIQANEPCSFIARPALTNVARARRERAPPTLIRLTPASDSCAAVVAGIRLGLLDSRVDVHTRGGLLTVDWPGSAGQLDAPVTLSGPATRVFEGEIELPDA